MLRHQAPGPYFTSGARCALCQHLQIERIVGLFKKHLPALVAPLGDKMRQSGNANGIDSGITAIRYPDAGLAVPKPARLERPRDPCGGLAACGRAAIMTADIEI